jgi:hypothetical protein
LIVTRINPCWKFTGLLLSKPREGIAVKQLMSQNLRRLGLLIFACAVEPVRTMGGGCAVSDGSELPSKDGCMLAFVYNQTDDHRLVVLDEKNHRRYEVPLERAKQAPFWEGGKVYVLDVNGNVQGFRIGTNALVADGNEALCETTVRTAEYARSQHRLYLIRTGFDEHQKTFYELLAIDFPIRKTLWKTRIDDPGLVRAMEQYVTVTGLESVQVFNCDTGEKIGEIKAAKAPAADTGIQK